MSIDRIDRSQATQQTESTRNAGKDRKVRAGTDSAAFSSKAAELNRLSNTVEDSPNERLAKVRAELESGTYRVSAKDLAEKLIDANRK